MEQKTFDDDGIDAPKKVWYRSYDPDFYEISAKSRVAPSWLSYQKVLSGIYANKPVKPLNNYIQNIGYQPSLIGISNDVVTIRHHLYADMYLDTDTDGSFYNVDRTWIRQYYLTNDVMPDAPNLFPGAYKFFVPWFIDHSAEVEYTPVEDSPFLIKNKKDFWFTPNNQIDHVAPHFVTFKFKNTGNHMRDDGLGIPRRGDPMFDMHMKINDIIVLKQIEEQYANN